jgi:hypothetical protein
MGGGLMQLVAYGAQDIYLTGNPQITFFKVVYRRHTNFSMEAIEQTFNGTADFGQSVTATISRNGDLVHRMYLEHSVTFEGPNSATGSLAILNDYGHRLMKDVELEIGGQRIDRHYGHWMSTWSQLSEFNPTGATGTLFNKMSGNGNAVVLGTAADGGSSTETGAWDATPSSSAEDEADAHIFVPLQFWFCRNPGLALPLIALQYHEVKVKVTFDAIVNLVREGTSGLVMATEGGVVSGVMPTFKLFADYIYLDTDERRRFAQVSHEYLIEQVQHSSYTGGGSMTLNFNHPVKELIWSVQRSFPTGNNFGANVAAAEIALDSDIDHSANWILKLNGHDRFSQRNTKYFTRAQLWQHHTGSPVGKADKIGVYSFALKPEEHQPSGTCNFSRIDNAQLVEEDASASQNYDVYAVNYNVLRIMSGMGGLAYSN